MAKVAVALLILGASSGPFVSKTGNHYLRPDDFPTVPENVRVQLAQAHCLIPQDVETVPPHNVVSGQFAHVGQQDWAAFCSVDGKSHVVVIWGGPSKCGGEPFGFNNGVADDSIYENADPGQWGRMPPHGSFWKLSVIPQSKVVARQRIGIVIAPLLEFASHDALQRSSIAGPNGVYCTSGKWRGLWYAD